MGDAWDGHPEADWLPALPVGRLGQQTLHRIRLGRSQHHRTGPWVVVEPMGSRLLRVGTRHELEGIPDLLFVDDLRETSTAA
jgi:hypothetical protein